MASDDQRKISGQAIPIVQEPSAVLRKKAEAVPAALFGSDAVRKVIADMICALESQDDGVAIAAPQIGVSYRIFVVSKHAIKNWRTHKVFINPSFVRIGKTKKELTEGCLSCRWKYGIVTRSDTATVRAYNEKGHEFQCSGKGLLAQIFQHETDHLDGILFIDKARNIEDLPPTQNNAQ
jgi:peptide deformylase